MSTFMLSRQMFGVLSVVCVALAQENLTQSCDVDFTTNAMPTCMQVCIEWCWATVIGEFKEYYQKRGTDSPMCRQSECKVVGAAIGQDCCTSLNTSKVGPHECGGGTAPGTCGGGATFQTILDQLKAEVPSQKWVELKGAPTDAQMQQILLSGSPIGRAGGGHIDAVVGCRPCSGNVDQGGCAKGSGGTEYRIIDPFVPASHAMWYSYNTTVHPVPDGSYTWESSYYSSGPKVPLPVLV